MCELFHHLQWYAGSKRVKGSSNLLKIWFHLSSHDTSCHTFDTSCHTFVGWMFPQRASLQAWSWFQDFTIHSYPHTHLDSKTSPYILYPHTHAVFLFQLLPFATNSLVCTKFSYFGMKYLVFHQTFQWNLTAHILQPFSGLFLAVSCTLPSLAMFYY